MPLLGRCLICISVVLKRRKMAYLNNYSKLILDTSSIKITIYTSARNDKLV